MNMNDDVVEPQPTMSFAERAKAKAAALKEAAAKKMDDLQVKPCVQCGTKDGVRRYDCAQCNTQRFCHKCTDYCSVSHNLVAVFTAREKVTEAAVVTKEKSVELYNKALLKWKTRKAAKEGAAAEGTTAGGQSLGEDGAAANPTNADARAAAAAEDPERTKIDEYTTKSVCRLCFRNSVQTLDLSRNYDIVGPYDNDINATIIAVHGGGASRASLRRMADQLIQYKIRTILVDLPGHGGRMDEALTMESAIEAIHTAATTVMKEATEKDSKAALLLLMGVGLGGYVATEYLGRSSPKKFDGAVIVSAGVGVGRDEASLLSRAALSIATSASQHLGAKTFTQAFLREIKKTPTLIKDEVHENVIDAGLYFHSATEQLNVLKSVSTKASLNRFYGPVLFMDGSADFHDMVDTYTKVAVDNELRTFRRGSDAEEDNDTDTAEGGLIILSRSIQYPKATQHFMHDTRFADESFADIAVFVQQLVDRADLVQKNPHLMLSAEEVAEVVRKQKEEAEAATAAAAAAAAAEAANKPKIGSQLFAKAKLFGSNLSNSLNIGKNNATATNSAEASTADVSSTAATADTGSVAGQSDVDAAEVNTRASSVSVAVPFSAAPVTPSTADAEVVVAAPAVEEEVAAPQSEEEAPAAEAEEETTPAVVEGEEEEAAEADAPKKTAGKKKKAGKN